MYEVALLLMLHHVSALSACVVPLGVMSSKDFLRTALLSLIGHRWHARHHHQRNAQCQHRRCSGISSTALNHCSLFRNLLSLEIQNEESACCRCRLPCNLCSGLRLCSTAATRSTKCTSVGQCARTPDSCRCRIQLR